MRKFIAISVALATIFCSFSANAQQPQRRITPNDTLRSVRVLPDGTTVFSIYAPKARTVSLTGDMMPWGQPVEYLVTGFRCQINVLFCDY